MRRISALSLFLLAITIVCSARDIAAVVSKANTIKTIALTDLMKMAKTSRKWPDGKAVMFVMKDPARPEMKIVTQKLFGMTADEVKTLIAANKQSFVIVDSDANVVKTVMTMPNSVGLLDVYSITGAVNVMKIDGKTPLEPGYALHGQ
jgi:hypothetical protein